MVEMSAVGLVVALVALGLAWVLLRGRGQEESLEESVEPDSSTWKDGMVIQRDAPLPPDTLPIRGDDDPFRTAMINAVFESGGMVSGNVSDDGDSLQIKLHPTTDEKPS